MTPSFSPDRSAAIRAELIATAARARTPQRRALWAVSLVLVGSLAGAGISTAAFAATGSFSADPAPAAPTTPAAPDLGAGVPAPPGTEPGSPVISLLGTPQSVRVNGPVEFPLEPPAGATHVRVTVTVTSPGTIAWGPDAGGNNPSSTASATDIATSTAAGWFDFPIDDGVTRLYFDVSGGAAGTAVVQYVNQVSTSLGVNAYGDTYGVEGGPDGQPDLILVSGLAPDGSRVEGYAWASALSGFSPEHAVQPSNPAEALEWQAERDEKYPTGWDIPVYESDGRTEIGTFHIG